MPARRLVWAAQREQPLGLGGLPQVQLRASEMGLNAPKILHRFDPLMIRRHLECILGERFLLTGMSGTGKSTVIGELVARGYKAVDADSDEFSQWVEVEGSSDAEVAPVDGNRDWMWREDRIQELLSTEDTDVLFVSGCAENMPKFFPQFDLIILLSAPASVIVQRLQTRTTNQYGKRPDEVARVLRLMSLSLLILPSTTPFERTVNDTW